MSQQKDYNNLEGDGSVLETQDLTLTSKNNTKKTDSELVREAGPLIKRSFSERWKTNRFWLVRGSYQFFRSVWMVAMIIGGFIAWLIAMLFI